MGSWDRKTQPTVARGSHARGPHLRTDFLWRWIIALMTHERIPWARTSIKEWSRGAMIDLFYRLSVVSQYIFSHKLVYCLGHYSGIIDNIHLNNYVWSSRFVGFYCGLALRVNLKKRLSHQGLFYSYGLTLIPAWISNNVQISNFIPHFRMSCWE